jgi:hypothetical protein
MMDPIGILIITACIVVLLIGIWLINYPNPKTVPRFYVVYRGDDASLVMTNYTFSSLAMAEGELATISPSRLPFILTNIRR